MRRSLCFLVDCLGEATETYSIRATALNAATATHALASNALIKYPQSISMQGNQNNKIGKKLTVKAYANQG